MKSNPQDTQIKEKDAVMVNYGMNGKVALVTGASGGIGRAAALAFAASEAAVLVCDVNQAGGEETVDLITQMGGKARFQACDVSNPDQVKARILELQP